MDRAAGEGALPCSAPSKGSGKASGKAAGGKSARPPPPGIAASSGGGDWRARAAEAAAAAAVLAEQNKPWRNYRVKALPSGPLEAPRWETAFDAEIPDAGTTRSVLFLATLAGSYCIKASLQPAEEFFATRFVQRCGCQAPAVRVLFKYHPEYEELAAAIRKVSELAGSRQDEEKRQQIMSMLSNGLAKPHLFVMAVVPSPVPFSRHAAAELLSLPGGVRDGASAPATLRLQALGRVWLAHALLGFRDCISFHPLMDIPEDHYSRTSSSIHLKRLVSTISANPDNFLLTAKVPPGSAGLYTIDSHVKRVSGKLQEAGREAQARSWHAFIDRLCREQRDDGAEESCMPFLRPVAMESCLEFLRDFVLTVTGGQEGDAALLERFEASIQPQVKTLCTLGIWPPSLNDDYMGQLLEKLRPGAQLRVLDGQCHDITPLAIRGGRFYGTENQLRLEYQKQQNKKLEYPVLIVDALPESPCGGEGFAGLCKDVAAEGATSGGDIGYRLREAELAEVRCGVLGLIRDIVFADEGDESSFTRWLEEASLELAQPDWARCEFWSANARRIDFAALAWYINLVRQAVQPHRALLDALPRQPTQDIEAERPGPTSSAAGDDEAIEAEAAAVGAAVVLWRALPHEVRHLVRKELRCPA